MKLQRLELFGFKSFADRVSIEFNPGVTAIVGPNGCGKSNISDAIRWVLGEQRPTLVRGSKMEEVIFNGSRERKPINLAEVRLHFSNEGGLLPVEYSEVSIARRVFREGESEYRLNRHVCRLKDIQDLFMGTGVGAHGYSLIQQGMVDQILSDRTEERRTLFEEAAGVTRYKTRRKATERKLEATTQDLVRVEDIVGEVEKIVASLKRQVGKTRRYLQYEAEERRLDAHATSRELEALAAREAPLVEELGGLADSEAVLAARLGDREATLEALEEELVETRETERTARTEAEALRSQIARREESRLVTGETLKHNQARLEALEAEDRRADERSSELAERRAALEVELEEAGARLQRVTGRMAPHADHAADEERHAELKAEQARLIHELESLRERLTEARQAAARQATAAEAAEERLDALEHELAARRREGMGADTVLASARAGLEESGGRRVEAEARERELEAALGEALARLEAAREELASERAAERAAASRLETLTALESRFEGYARGARTLLSGDGSRDGLAGSLPQAVEPTERRFETALERYLESLGNALLVRDRGVAERAADRLLEEDAGRADLLVPEYVATGAPPEIPDAAAAVVVGRGMDVLRWTGEASLGERLRPLFERLLLVDDRYAALRCREALAASPEAARHYVVAGLDGTLIEPTGRWRTPGAEGDEGLLARRRRRAEAEAELIERRAAVSDRIAEAAAAEDEVELGEAEAAEARAAREAAHERHRAAREALAVAEESASQTARRVAELETQHAEQVANRDRAREASEDQALKSGALEADESRARERLTDVRASLERLDAVRAERLSARHAVELERAEAEAELRALERELEHVAGAERSLAAGREEREAERVSIERSNERLAGERAATAAEIETLHGDLDVVESRVREASQRVSGIEERRVGWEAEARALRRSHDDAVERRHAAQLSRQEIGHRRQTLLDHLAETYEQDLDALLAANPLDEEEVALTLDELRPRLEQVRRKRANLGPVNMLAVEEYDRESERLAFLVTQRDDLVQAKRQLEEAIRRINATARELFEETFAAIRDNFGATFRTLFEGGQAELRLAEPDDPLESPIDIVASPRGKRVQHLSLLSGGERALTALALLFAIYQVKPSPFCILDEVDAPLDEANVGRFLHMIRHFTGQTQFIVITHNKRTMEAADYLYGVTMEEPGVSTLVSVSLEEDSIVPAEDRRIGLEEALAAAS